MRTRRSLAAVLTLGAVVAAMAPVALLASPAGAVQSFTFTRISGANRHDTAAKTALATFSSAPAVVIARDAAGTTDADALASSFIAGNKPGPILLTTADALPPETDAALAQLKPTSVVIMGGTTAVSTAVEDSLRARGYAVQRVAGVDRYATAAAAALLPEVSTAVIDGKLSAFLARSEGLVSPDALAAGPVSFAAKIPVLLTTRDTTPEATTRALTDRPIQHIFLLGGTEAISSAQQAALEARGITTTRIAGANRSGTAVAMAQFAHTKLGFSRTHVNLARGDDSADALAAGPHGGTERAPLLITESACALDDASTGAFLRAESPRLLNGHILGGTAAVCESVEAAATAAARGQAAPPAGPSSLGFSATSGSRAITLTIGGSPTSNVTSYNVYRAATDTCVAFQPNTGPYTKIATVNDVSPNTGDPSTQTYVDTTTADRTSYCYVVTAVSSSGESQGLVVGPVTSGAGAPAGSTAPQPPATITFTTSSSSQAVTLTIGDSPTPQTTAYNVYRAPASTTCPTFGSTYTLVRTVNDSSPGAGSSGSVTVVDTAAANTTYCYAVTAVSSGGESVPTVVGPLTTGSAPGGGGGGSPSSPGVGYTTSSSTSTITVVVSDSATPSVTSYDLYRAPATSGTCPAFGSGYTKLTTFADPSPGSGATGSVSYSDTSAAAQSSYCYAATAISSTGTSAATVVGPAVAGGGTGGGGSTTTAPPATVSWSVSNNSKDVVLTIGDSPSAGVTTYTVHRTAVSSGSTTCPAFSKTAYPTQFAVPNTGASSETFTDTSTAAQTTYCYAVTATGPNGESSAVVVGPLTTGVAPAPGPQPPSSFTYAFFGNSKRVELVVGESGTTTVDEYRIYRIAASTCPAFSPTTWTLALTIADNNTGPYEVTDNGTVAQTTYCYAAVAVDGTVLSAPLLTPPFTVGG